METNIAAFRMQQICRNCYYNPVQYKKCCQHNNCAAVHIYPILSCYSKEQQHRSCRTQGLLNTL